LLCEISGGRLTSSRTGWVPNLTEATPDERLPRIGPGQDAQADGVSPDTGVGTLSDEVPLGLLGGVALSDEGSTAGLMIDASKRLVAAPCSAGIGRC